MVKAIILKLKNSAKALPVSKLNKNLPGDGLLPDIEFQYNGATYIIDVRFSKAGYE